MEHVHLCNELFAIERFTHNMNKRKFFQHRFHPVNEYAMIIRNNYPDVHFYTGISVVMVVPRPGKESMVMLPFSQRDRVTIFFNPLPLFFISGSNPFPSSSIMMLM